jgi:hypothetical protein
MKKPLSDELLTLIRAMRARRQGKPLSLLLGSAVGPLDAKELEAAVLASEMAHDRELVHRMTDAERAKRFRTILRQLDPERRFLVVSAAFRAAQKKTWEDAYLALAKLIQDEYFNVVFTTQIHALLENALIETKLSWDIWRVMVVRPDQPGNHDLIRDQLRAAEPRVKIVKLYGDMYERSFAVSAEDRRQYDAITTPLLSDHFRNEGTVIVGHAERDSFLAQSMPKRLEHLYYVSPDLVPPGLQFSDSQVIADEISRGDAFFPLLYEQLHELDNIVAMTKVQEKDEDVKDILESETPIATAIDKQRKLVEAVGDLEVRNVDTSLVEETEPPMLLRIDYDGYQVTFSLTGPFLRYRSPHGRQLRLNVHGLSTLARDLGHDIASGIRPPAWRGRIKWEGERLHQDLFASDPDLMQRFGAALQAARREEKLQICFAGPRDHLRLPYEFIADDSLHWILRFPLYHEVTGVAGRSPVLAALLDQLEEGQAPLRVLLVASNTGGGIDPDAEVDALQVKIAARAARIAMRIEVHKLRTEEASLEEVKRRLDHCRYHIVHFAGHSTHDEQQGESSSLLFWDGPGTTGQVVPLTAATLQTLLRGGQTSLLFLSCCRGTASGGQEMLYDGDALGLADAAVHAGVPAVLGFRWAVADESARSFAESFYDALLTSRDPAEAALSARKVVYQNNPEDETWAAAVLVMQGA